MRSSQLFIPNVFEISLLSTVRMLALTPRLLRPVHHVGLEKNISGSPRELTQLRPNANPSPNPSACTYHHSCLTSNINMNMNMNINENMNMNIRQPITGQRISEALGTLTLSRWWARCWRHRKRCFLPVRRLPGPRTSFYRRPPWSSAQKRR